MAKKKNTPDYTKLTAADELLREAQVKLKWHSLFDAEQRIRMARDMMKQYIETLTNTN